MLKLPHFIVFSLVIFVNVQSGEIEPKLFQHLNEDYELRFNIFVTLKGDESKSILKNLERTFKTTRMGNGQKSEAVMRGLKMNAESTQREVIDLISDFARNQGAEIKRFWINDLIYIKGAKRDLIKYISELSRVERVFEEFQIQLDGTISRSQNENILNVPSQLCYEIPPWGIKKIKADKVLNSGSIFQGENITVGIIDTGVNGGHEALIDNYVGGYFGSIDFTGETEMSSLEPSDFNGHGTHVTGIAVGGRGIGVAPGAKWMSCKGCDKMAICNLNTIIMCAQWMMCPYKIVDGKFEQDCSKAPKIINNSWTSSIDEYDIFGPLIRAWKASGVVPVFAVGNNGDFGCDCPLKGQSNQVPYSYTHKLYQYLGLVAQPAMSLADVISVGNTDKDDSLHHSSSLGPSMSGIQTPDISAPGTDNLSAYHANNISYVPMTGTSMAAPHVTGVVALLRGLSPELTFDQIQEILINTSEKNLKYRNEECGDIFDNVYPNNHFGHGRLDAFEAIEVVFNGGYNKKN